MRDLCIIEKTSKYNPKFYEITYITSSMFGGEIRARMTMTTVDRMIRTIRTEQRKRRIK